MPTRLQSVNQNFSLFLLNIKQPREPGYFSDVVCLSPVWAHFVSTTDVGIIEKVHIYRDWFWNYREITSLSVCLCVCPCFFKKKLIFRWKNLGKKRNKIKKLNFLFLDMARQFYLFFWCPWKKGQNSFSTFTRCYYGFRQIFFLYCKLFLEYFHFWVKVRHF